MNESAIQAGAEGMEDYLVQLNIGTDPEDEAGPTIEYARILTRAALSKALDHLASTDEGRAYLKALLKEHDG